MLIILEGPDGVGKTTLANQLHDIIKRDNPRDTVVIIRKGPPTSHPLDEYAAPLLSYRPDQGLHLILDRWHLGEYVYPRISGRTTQLDDVNFWYLNQLIRRLGGLLVLCHSTVDRAEQVYRRRESTHPFEQPGVYEKVESMFHEAVDKSWLPQVTYDWHDCCSVSPENMVLTARTRASLASGLSDFVTLVGRLIPEYLLLGDVRHALDVQALRAFSTDPRPAFMPYRSTSGHWLIQSILTSAHLQQSVALANACDVDDVFELWDMLDKPRVVALGRNSARELARIGNIPFGVVPHPQFGRRFHHREQSSYADALLRALENQEDYSKWRGSLPVATAVKSTAKS